MNTFYEHHKGSINFAYRCFDRILLNGMIQPFQQPERVIGFFNAYRNAERVSPELLHLQVELAAQLPYCQAAALLDELLPETGGLNYATTRYRTLAVGKRIKEIRGEIDPRAPNAMNAGSNIWASYTYRKSGSPDRGHHKETDSYV
jgi:hypothetical protein